MHGSWCRILAGTTSESWLLRIEAFNSKETVSEISYMDFRGYSLCLSRILVYIFRIECQASAVMAHPKKHFPIPPNKPPPTHTRARCPVRTPWCKLTRLRKVRRLICLSNGHNQGRLATAHPGVHHRVAIIGLHRLECGICGAGGKSTSPHFFCFLIHFPFLSSPCCARSICFCIS